VERLWKVRPTSWWWKVRERDHPGEERWRQLIMPIEEEEEGTNKRDNRERRRRSLTNK